MPHSDDSNEILPFDEDYTDEELELLEEIDDSGWQAVVRQFCILRRKLKQDGLESDERKIILDELQDVKSEMTDLRAVHRNANAIREGRHVDLY